MNFPPSPCPAWCRQTHATPDLAHIRDLGTWWTRGNAYTIALMLVEDAESAFLRIHVSDEHGHRFHDMAYDAAAAIGRAITTLDPKYLRQLGLAFTEGAGLLLTGENGETS